MKKLFMMFLLTLTLAACQTTKLSNLDKSNICLALKNSNALTETTVEDSKLLLQLSENFKNKLKYPEVKLKELGC